MSYQKKNILRSIEDKIVIIKKRDNNDYKPIMILALREEIGNYNYIIYDYPDFYIVSREEIINNFIKVFLYLRNNN